MRVIKINLEQVLKERGISKNKICQNCQMERTQLNKYCANKISRVDLGVLSRLCHYLKCTPNDLLIFSEPDPDDPDDET